MAIDSTLPNGELLLARYAELLVECGWGGEKGIKGKPVHILHSAPAYELMLAIAERAYRTGASRVDCTTLSPALDALHVQYADDPNLVYVPKHWADRWNDLVDVRGACVRIDGTDRPLALSNCDPKRVSRFETARIRAREKFYEEGLQKNTTPWSIIPFATTDWGLQLFPELSPDDARCKLEAALIRILELDREDFVARWWSRGAKISERCRRLNDLKVETLEFRGPDTHLDVGLHERAIFGGGMHDGEIRFFANLPTFESYTTPDLRRTAGHVAMTRPILINGQTVSGLKVSFEQGRVAKFSAQTGAAAFEAMLNEDEGARFIGEVALVGIDDSPIYSTGIVFQTILLDENAACHIAFGRAYPSQIRDGEKMSEAERAEIGCNYSRVHRDCMISNEQTSVLAVTRSGGRVPVIERGAWSGQFK